MKKTEYHVYAECFYGSDLLECDTYEEALEKASEWAKESKYDIVIEKVERSIAKRIEVGK